MVAGIGLLEDNMIIGISGLIGSGKGTVADILVEEHGFKKANFADSLKDAVSIMFGWPRHLLEGDTKESREWREEPDVFWSIEMRQEMTPRLALQLVGTEAMRRGFFEGIWVSSLKQKVLSDSKTNWVISDTRFPNEIQMIHDVGGKMIRVRRGEDPVWFRKLLLHNEIPIDVHESEWAWAKSKFDFLIENDGSLEELKEKVKNLTLGRQYEFPKCH